MTTVGDPSLPPAGGPDDLERPDALRDDEGFDGYTLDRLSDYLDAGMSPADPRIDTSAACQMALASLRRVREASTEFLDAEAERESQTDSGWIERILGAISLDAHSGRSIPITHPSATARITTSEGAIRGLVRAAGDSVSGLIVGRCRLDGDVSLPGAPIMVRVDASVFWGQQIRERATALQRAVTVALSEQTELTITEVDVTVHDIFVPPRGVEVEGDKP